MIGAYLIVALMILPGYAPPTAPGSQGTGTVLLAVTDAKGRPVPGLSPRDVSVRVDGVERQVMSVRQSTEAPAIVIIVDGYTEFATLQMRRALRSVLDVIRASSPDAQVAFMMSEGPTPPTLKHVNKDAAALDREAAAFLRGGASAPMLECVMVAARALGEAPSRRRLIFLLTSQRDSLPATDTAEVVGEVVRRSGASLWALQSTLPALQSGAVENERVMKTVTRASGGRREQRLTWLIEEHAVAMTRQMLSQYEVTFDLPATLGPGHLRVGVTGGRIEVFAPGWVTRQGR